MKRLNLTQKEKADRYDKELERQRIRYLNMKEPELKRRRDRARKYARQNKDKIKEYRIKNKDKIKEYRIKNKDKIKEYRIKNKDKIKEYHRNYMRKYRTKNKK